MQQNPSKQQKLTFHQVYQLTDVSEVYFGSFLSTFVPLTYITASACKVLEPNHAPFKFTAVVRAHIILKSCTKDGWSRWRPF